MTVNPFSAGAVRARALNDALDNTKITKMTFSDLVYPGPTASSPGLQVPELVFDVIAGGYYVVDGFIIYTASPTADIVFQFLQTDSNTFLGTTAWRAPVTTASTATNVEMSGNISPSNSAGGAGTTPPAMTMRPGGYIATGAQSNQIYTTIYQATAEATSITLKQGSWLSLRRVL